MTRGLLAGSVDGPRITTAGRASSRSSASRADSASAVGAIAGGRTAFAVVAVRVGRGIVGIFIFRGLVGWDAPMKSARETSAAAVTISLANRASFERE